MLSCISQSQVKKKKTNLLLDNRDIGGCHIVTRVIEMAHIYIQPFWTCRDYYITQNRSRQFVSSILESMELHFAIIIITFFFYFMLYVNSVASSSNDELKNCSRISFKCGDFASINTYPFWGDARPHYCGLPDFELKCQGNYPYIDIMSHRYRVLQINQENKVMRIVNSEFLSEDTNCPWPSSLVNATLNSTPFTYSNRVQKLTLFTGCYNSLGSNEFIHFFECRTDVSSVGNMAYFVETQSLVEIPSENLPNCTSNVTVPVLKTSFTVNSTNLHSVLGDGFEVDYNDDISTCNDDICSLSGGKCGYNFEFQKTSCVCPDRIDGRRVIRNGETQRCLVDQPAGSGLGKKILIGTTTGGATTLALLILVLVLFLRKTMTGKSDDQIVETFFKNGSLVPKRYRYLDVKRITNSFTEKLGQGGYGSVFKGQLHDGILVAVKVLFNNSKTNGEDFINEVESISKTSHVNVVTLLGFCFEGKKRALIYEFMPNGSLEKFIYNEATPPTSLLTSRHHHLQLGWETLYQIAIGIARGLEYLHRGCNTRILHFDIKPHNILLDQEFCPKITDFGLAKLCPRKESIISILGTRGTSGYIAPEVFNRNFGGVSYKSDVYSYGMMILEMVGGRKNMDVDVGMNHSSQLYYPHWIYERLKQNEDLGLKGPDVMTEAREEVARKMIIVGFWCIQTKPSDRPSMTKVLDMLEGSVEILQIPPKPFLAVPSKSPSMSSSAAVSVSIHQ